MMQCVMAADHHQPSVRCDAKITTKDRDPTKAAGVSPMIDPRSALGDLKAIYSPSLKRRVLKNALLYFARSMKVRARHMKFLAR
jgi:hypothetical protein